MGPDDVVCGDSILQNKEMTKTYWEERMMADSANKSPHKDSMSGDEVFTVDSLEDSHGPKIVETVVKTRIQDDTESRIALELREMKEREEELRQLRQVRLSSDNHDVFQSIPSTDEGNFSENGSEQGKEISIDSSSSPLQEEFSHIRTQSMDSISSGHSSAPSEPAPPPARRRVVVKPLDEPQDDEIPAYLRHRLGETPIEREIRQVAQREEELRRQQSVPLAISSPVTPTSGTKWNLPRAGGIANDSRDVQHRLATSRIQLEIQEATIREKELVAAGKIQTISEDTVDSKVTRFTELAEYAIAEKERKKQAELSIIDLPPPPTVNKSSPDTTDEKTMIIVSDVVTTPKKPTELNLKTTTLTRPAAAINIKPALKSPMFSPNVRKFDTSGSGQRGLMQRFLASRGRIVGISSFSSTSSNTSPIRSSAPTFITSIKPMDNAATTESTQAIKLSPSAIDCIDSASISPATRTTPIRKGYMSAEEKIQEELIEMKKREDELRLQRAHMFAQSQPNLLSLLEDEDAECESEKQSSVSCLRSALSNPNLLESADDTSSLDSTSYQEKKATRKRSALIAQWENMIQQYSDQ